MERQHFAGMMSPVQEEWRERCRQGCRRSILTDRQQPAGSLYLFPHLNAVPAFRLWNSLTSNCAVYICLEGFAGTSQFNLLRDQAPLRSYALACKPAGGLTSWCRVRRVGEGFQFPCPTRATLHQERTASIRGTRLLLSTSAGWGKVKFKTMLISAKTLKLQAGMPVLLFGQIFFAPRKIVCRKSRQ